MNLLNTIKQQSFKLFSASGQTALASFLICLVSGVALAIPYDVTKPFESVSMLVLTNPWASFFRNLHYWSAQLFTLMTLLHLLDHEYRRSTKDVKPSIWMRLTMSVPVVFFVMITGFILKGDSDGLQALQIIGSLLLEIPAIGNLLKDMLIGHEGSLQIVYVHHIATASIFLLLLIFEHARLIWPRIAVSFNTILFTVLLSALFQAPLHDGLDGLMKGPWYFIGLQEIMHFTSYPILLWLGFIILLSLVFLLPKCEGKRYQYLSKLLILIILAYTLLSLNAFAFRGNNWVWMLPGKSLEHISGSVVQWNPVWAKDTAFKPDLLMQESIKKESCLGCHAGMTGLSDSHNPAAIGCASCHGGNPWATTATVAHSNMRLIPGNLADASLSCGQTACHQQIASDIHTGLMATLSGMISVDRWVFGEINSPNKLCQVNDLGNSPADQHLKNLCIGCHLGSEKTEPGTAHYLQKGGGCLACHLVYSPKLDQEVKKYYAKKTTKLPGEHPNLSLYVTDDKCFTCHNRSGRIATNYEGWSETRYDTMVAKRDPNFKIIEQNRVFTKQTADIHHDAGMGCIDCHTAFELMGDGNLYQHKEDMVKTACEDCHQQNPNSFSKLDELDRISQNIIALNQYLEKKGNYLKQSASPFHYTNILKDSSENLVLIVKNSGKRLPIKHAQAICTSKNIHKSLTCNACHAVWAPTCLGCHNTYDAKAPGYNHQLQKNQKGSWIEHIGSFDASPPTLGVRIKEGQKEIIPYVPGMVLSIDQSPFKTNKSLVFKRIFAPVSPHTSNKARNCKSCHNNPVALGYGDGALKFERMGQFGKWSFEPKYASNQHDGLPEDAWINFLTPTPNALSTRLDHRPFTVEEQKAILLVGSCLSCHNESSPVMVQSLTQWPEVLKKRKKACIEPSY